MALDQSRPVRRRAATAPTRRASQAAETLAALASERHLPGWVHARFRRSLSLDDAEDVAAEAFAQAARHLAVGSLPASRGELDLWLKKAAYHRAIDLVRRRRGEGRTPRPPLFRLSDVDEATLAEAMGTDADPLSRMAAAEHRAATAALVRAAMAALTARERRALRLRHVTGLPVSVCAHRLGVTRSKFERLHTRAVKRMRLHLAAMTPSPECEAVRAQLGTGADRLSADRLSDALNPPVVEAHLAECVPCRLAATAEAQAAA